MRDLAIAARRVRRMHMVAQRMKNIAELPGMPHYVAYAKESPFTTFPVNFVTEPGTLWFEMGDTEQEAICKLEQSMLREFMQ